MATGSPCKKCKRDCMVPGLLVNPVGVIPPIFIDYSSNYPVAEVFVQPYLDYIKNGIQNNGFCNGDISAYCLQAILDAVNDKIKEIVDIAISSLSLLFGNCYYLWIDGGIAITAECQCNDDDISNGNGPASAKVDVGYSGYLIHKTDCGRPA
jgi:hypothetical protein